MTVSAVKFGLSPRPTAIDLNSPDAFARIFEEAPKAAEPQADAAPKQKILTFQNAKRITLGGIKAYAGYKLAKWAFQDGITPGILSKAKAGLFGYLAYKLLGSSLHTVTGHNLGDYVPHEQFKTWAPQLKSLWA